MESSGRRQFLLSKGWLQAIVLVVLFGFTVLGILAYRTYDAKPPLPDRVVDQNGRVLYSAADIKHGQQTFLHHGLMEYGSVFGQTVRDFRTNRYDERTKTLTLTGPQAGCSRCRSTCSSRSSSSARRSSGTAIADDCDSRGLVTPVRQALMALRPCLLGAEVARLPHRRSDADALAVLAHDRHVSG